MKKITLNLLKGLLVIVLFTGVSVALSTTGVQTVSEAKAGGPTTSAGSSSSQGVTASSVNQYLIAHAYTNITSMSVTSSSSSGSTWTAIAVNGSGSQVRVTVYASTSQIVGQQDVSL
ncbi:MAG TPA: hypothetical protein VFF27_00860 [Bacteroidia bacterium]|jgi:hypothetical protein|nr:hypothetical protein [Bacteroidia bacterium]